ncbi:MAG: hypothetical protein ACOX2M_03890 [Fastidiosipilaceae bacterium]|jgi:hypothetical protein
MTKEHNELTDELTVNFEHVFDEDYTSISENAQSVVKILNAFEATINGMLFLASDERFIFNRMDTPKHIQERYLQLQKTLTSQSTSQSSKNEFMHIFEVLEQMRALLVGSILDYDYLEHNLERLAAIEQNKQDLILEKFKEGYWLKEDGDPFNETHYISYKKTKTDQLKRFLNMIKEGLIPTLDLTMLTFREENQLKEMLIQKINTVLEERKKNGDECNG